MLKSHNSQIILILSLSVAFIIAGTFFINSQFSGAATYEWWVDWEGEHYGHKIYKMSIGDVDLYGPLGNPLQKPLAKVVEFKMTSGGNGFRVTCPNQNAARDTDTLYLKSYISNSNLNNPQYSVKVYFLDKKLNKAVYCNEYSSEVTIANLLAGDNNINLKLSGFEYGLEEYEDVSYARNRLKLYVVIDAPNEDIYQLIRTDKDYGNDFTYLGVRWGNGYSDDITTQNSYFGQRITQESLGTHPNDYITYDGIYVYQPRDLANSDRLIIGIPKEGWNPMTKESRHFTAKYGFSKKYY